MEHQQTATPWRTVEELAAYAKVSKKSIYAAVASGKLRAARVGGRRDIRGKDSWTDAWLEATATPQETSR